MKLKNIRKALVAAATLLVALGLLDEGTAQDAVAALTPLLVFLVPND